MSRHITSVIEEELDKSQVARRVYDCVLIERISTQVTCFYTLVEYVEKQVVESFKFGYVIHNPQMMLTHLLDAEISHKIASELSTSYSSKIEKLISRVFFNQVKKITNELHVRDLSLYDDDNFNSLVREMSVDEE